MPRLAARLSLSTTAPSSRLLLAALLLGACAAPQPAAPVAPVAVDVGIATALQHTVFMPDPGCTAVDVGNGFVVTAKHCTTEMQVGDVTAIGMFAHASVTEDFAIFYDVARTTHLVPAMRSCVFGEHLYTVGYPVQKDDDTQQLTATDGLCAGPLNGDGEARITAPIYYGNSGGGVWGEDGALLGLSVNGYLNMPAMNYMVPSVDLGPWVLPL